jgi:hypothetical protein
VSADILIVDEALSVGDQPFQQKCFDQLRRFRESGGTSILVSHDNFSIKRFCDSAIWLRNGEVIESGNSGTVVDKYRDWCDSIEGVSYSKEKCLGRNLDEIDKTEKIGTTNTRIIHSDEILEVDSHGIEVLEENGDNSIRQLSKCILSFTIANKGLGLGRNIRLGFWLRDSKAVEICGSNTLQELGDLVAPMKGESVDIIFKFALPAIPPGFYSIRFNIDARHTGEDKLDKWETLVLVDSCLPFTVELDKSMLDRPMGLLGLPCSVYAEQRSTKA